MTTQTTTSTPTLTVQNIISKQQFIDKMLNLRKGNVFITITTRTIPALTGGKSNPWKDKIVKIAVVNCSVGFDYENNVNNQRIREDKETDFKAEKPLWGNRIGNSALIEHNGETYLYVRFMQSCGYRYETLDGKPLENDFVHAMLPVKSSPKQDLEKEIVVRKYKLSSVIGIKIDGQQFVIVH